MPARPHFYWPGNWQGWGNYDEDVKEAWKRSVDSLRRMTRHPEKSGLILAFEILQPTESNLMFDFVTTVRMMDEIQSDHFKLCVDTVPVGRGGNTMDDFFQKINGRICHIHLTDGNRSGHIPFGLGEHLLNDYLSTLCQCDYSGYITLEIGDMGWDMEPEKATLIALDTVHKALQVSC